MYSARTSVILLCMVVTGAGRSVGVKLFYQLGYNNPLFVSLLYLLGQSLSLVVYWATQRRSLANYEPVELELQETIVFQDEENIGKQIGDDVALMGLVAPGNNDNEPIVKAATTLRKSFKRQGSQHGLTDASKQAVSWIHRIPWYLKPLIPGFFNLCNAALRWASFVYVPASVAEMLIVGTEIILSVIAARLVRKRMVSWNRGVGLRSSRRVFC